MGNKNSSEESVYLNGRPTFHGDKVTPCFKDKGNGMLFRIVQNKKKWAFYNDSAEYEFHVTVTFNEDCDIKALDQTTLEQMEDGKWVGKAVVYPTQTVMFIKGRVNGFTSKMDAFAVSSEGQAFYESNKAEMQRLIDEEAAKKKKK